MIVTRWMVVSCCLLATCALVPSSLPAGELTPDAVAKKVDELLVRESFGAADAKVATPVAQADDPTFLRRVSLDLIGVPPTPDEITAYSLNPSSDKRAATVERLLANPRFGDNWARYWRDVIMTRRSEDRALLASDSLVRYLTEAFNSNQHWDEIATRFITATGDIREEGPAALIMAQNGSPEDTTAEVSRIFLGIQIQCAQCHNHPTDRWKREQFHELAAFFPRIVVRAVRDGEKRSFAVTAVDREGKNNGKRPGGRLEHHMPDLQHPEAKGKQMQPVFFATGQHLDSGTKDADRRQTLADWMTDGSSRWFAKAYVNRMWSELVGRGFYEPVDDIGPDRQCSAPQTLDYLSDRFAANHFDVKWLLTTITATEAYGRQSRSRVDDGSESFASTCPQRLRGDQLYNTLIEALGISDPKPKNDREAYRPIQAGPRGKLNLTFGYDPSVRRDEIAGSIPQALFLMNSPEVNAGLNSKRPTTIGRLLEEVKRDEDLVEELYLRCLAREPKATELQTCVDHVRTTQGENAATGRAEGFEDVLWALVNSTEFLNRR